MPPIVTVAGLTKHYQVAEKAPGLAGALAHFFRRRYKAVEAVKGITFAIEPGEIVGFLGPNGAGKTTVLKMLSGLVHPTAGTVRVADRVPFAREKQLLMSITLVMGGKQQLIWDLPARDSYRINAAVYELDDATAATRIAALASMLDMATNLDKPVRKLSLGERMKAELIAALLHHPKVLFLDEPTLGLDVNAQATIRTFLAEYCRTTGATILLTSHYMADITALCQRVLVIDQGVLRYDGSLAGIHERFAPYREVSIELARPIDRAQLAGMGEIESLEGRSAKLLVDRSKLTQIVARVMGELEVTDLTVSDPPIEQVIAKVFKDGATAAAAPPAAP